MRLRGPLTRASVVTIVALLVLGTAAAGVPGNVTGHVAAQAPDDPTPIASCTTITEPGEYVLTQDLAANGSADACLRIDVIGTVVIDGQGHSVEGGIDGETDSADETDVTLVLELRNATVDTISYPSGDFTGGGGASGLLENVTVGAIEMSNADGLTIESSRVENDIEGWYAGDVTLRNSTFVGGLVFFENTVDFEIVNTTFEDEVVFHEYLQNSYVADNTFRSSLEIFNAGGPSENVTIENNRITIAADRADGLEAGGIVFVDVADSVVRNNTIVVERDEGTTATESNGIFIGGERNLIQGNTISGADHGIYVYRSDDRRIVDNTIAGNDVGILFDRSSDRVTNNTIADNRVGVEVITEDGDEHIRVAFERNLLANNTEFGVKNSVPGEFVFDARNNYWGTADGPSSAPANDSDAPFADSVTGTLADGSDDALSEGKTAGVSNVRFDPFLTAPSNDTEDEERFYQVDFVAGDVIHTFGPADSDQFYSDQERLIRFLHGSTTTPVERTDAPPTLSTDISSCIEVESFEVSGDTATVRYTVASGCSLDVALVSYEKPGPGWSRATASDQRLVAAEKARATDPGTYELTVSLPTNTTATETNEAPSISRSP